MGAADLGEGATVSIGLFIGHDRFSQIALADGNGRVFVTSDPHADTHDMKPRFMLVKEEELDAVDGARFGAKARPPSAVTGASTGESAGTVRAFQGGIVGRDATGRMTWLASWLKTGNRYTLEQMRSPLPASLRQRLEYRDAISIAFLAAYMLPEMRGCSSGSDRATSSVASTVRRRWVPYAAAYATRWRLARTACGRPVWRIISPT